MLILMVIISCLSKMRFKHSENTDKPHSNTEIKNMISFLSLFFELEFQIFTSKASLNVYIKPLLNRAQ